MQPGCDRQLLVTYPTIPLEFAMWHRHAVIDSSVDRGGQFRLLTAVAAILRQQYSPAIVRGDSASGSYH